MNGSGKTTLVKLLCRLYDPTAGCILVDGSDLASFDISEVRRNISVVFQDYAHYDLTARDNIWLGNLDLPAGDERIILAAQNAGVDEKIRGLKAGYETVLGTWIEDGEELSIGQWQKIALARSFVRDAQIVILDEPTSALDPKAEAEVFEQFRRLAVGRSVILISHRLSTVKMSDRIYVIEDGRIAESGSHEALLQQKGQYSSLYEVQARSYQ
jgi:ATP-binding cassette subfamily B protein